MGWWVRAKDADVSGSAEAASEENREVPVSVGPAGADDTGAGIEIFTLFLIPVVFLAVVALRMWHDIAIEPLWVYGVIFGLTITVGRFVQLQALKHPSTGWLHVQAATASAITTSMIYLTGWGPALITGYSIVAVMTIVKNGSRAWRLVVGWNLAAVVVGELAVWVHLAPSFMPLKVTAAISMLAAVSFIATIRIASLAASEKELAETQLRANEDRFRSLVAHSSDTTLLLDRHGAVICYASPASESLLGLEPHRVVGHNPSEIVHPEDLDRVVRDIADVFASTGLLRTEFRVVRPDGTTRYVDGVITDLRANPAVDGFVVNLHDVTERKELELWLEHQAHHDVLTGLPNRLFLLERLQEAMARTRRRGEPKPMLLFLDLDHFKEVNDRLGHAAGDELLVQFGRRLASMTRAGEILARFGGDEFAILGEENATDEAKLGFARRVRKCVEEPFLVQGESCQIGMSVGIAVIDGSASPAQVLAHADEAMYRAKHQPEGVDIHLLGSPYPTS